MEQFDDDDEFAKVMRQVEHELRDAAERLNYLLHTNQAKEPTVMREVNVYMNSIVLLADMIGEMKDTPSG